MPVERRKKKVESEKMNNQQKACKVVKFGGSSLADAEHFRKVHAIVTADPARRYVVPSAPGKRNKGDTKVTDMLYECYNVSARGEAIDTIFARLKER